jgi:hypothetical protein
MQASPNPIRVYTGPWDRVMALNLDVVTSDVSLVVLQ